MTDKIQQINDNLHTVKTLLTNNLTNRGVTVASSETFDNLVNKINDINIKIPVTITLTSDKTSLNGTTDTTAHLEAKVVDYGNNPVEGVTISFLENGSSLSQSLTNENGIATYDYSEVNGGTFSLTVELSPISVYNGSVSNTVSVSVTVETFTADIYVSPTGSDSNNGLTQDTAVATLSKAIELVSTGGTIGLLNGTYTVTPTVSINKSCTIKGQSQSSVIINGNNKIYSIKYTGTDNLRVTNCTFTSANNGIWNYSTGTVTITNCTFTSNSYGIFNKATGTVTATNCTFTSNTWGIYNVSTGTVTATNCTFTSNTNYDVYNKSGTVILHCNTYTSGTAKFNNCTEGSCP